MNNSNPFGFETNNAPPQDTLTIIANKQDVLEFLRRSLYSLSQSDYDALISEVNRERSL